MLQKPLDKEVISDMTNLMMGCSHNDKQINILIFLVNKIHMENLPYQTLDEMLNLFVVVYLKCSKAVQLSFLDDLDKIGKMIKDESKSLFVQKAFKYKVLFPNMY